MTDKAHNMQRANHLHAIKAVTNRCKADWSNLGFNGSQTVFLCGDPITIFLCWYNDSVISVECFVLILSQQLPKEERPPPYSFTQTGNAPPSTASASGITPSEGVGSVDV